MSLGSKGFDMKSNISVLMSVYINDKLDWLKQSIESITLKQNLKPDELVLVIDGPIPDDIHDYIDNLDITPVKLIKVVNPQNMGLAISLNIGLKHCNCKYVARMDSDDVAINDRFSIQLPIIESGVYAVVGSNYFIFDSDISRPYSQRVVPEHIDAINKNSGLKNPINHPTILFDKEIALKVGGYPDDIGRFEDWGFALSILSNSYRIYNIQQNLLYFRSNEEMMLRRGGLGYAKEEMIFFLKSFKRKLLPARYIFINLVLRLPVRFMPKIILRLFYKNYIWKKNIQSV